MNEINRNITPVFDTILDRALFDLQHALAMQDYPLAWLMQKKLVYMTADAKIYGACVPFIDEVEKELKRLSSYTGYTAADRYTHVVLGKKQYLEEKVYQFLPRIMLLLEEHGLLHKAGGSSSKTSGTPSPSSP